MSAADELPAPEPADVRAETELAARIAGELQDRAAAEFGMVIVSAPVGAPVIGAVRRALAETGDRAAWIHTLPERADGAQRALAHGEDGDGEQVTVAGASMGETLDQFAAHLTPGSVLVLDGFHALTPASANTLVVWSQAARARGIRVVVGYHPALDAGGVGALLHVAVSATWIDVRALSPEAVREDLRGIGAWTSPAVLDLAVDACASNVAMLRSVRRTLTGEARIDAAAVVNAFVRALEACAMRLITDQGSDAMVLAELVGLVHPEVCASRAAHSLDLPPATATRLEHLIRELGLCPDSDALARGAGELISAQMPLDVRRTASRVAHDLLEVGQVGQRRLFLVRAAVGDPLTGSLDLARAAYDEAWEAGDLARAEATAATLAERSADPNEVAWARAAQLRCWARTDWAAFAAHVDWCADGNVVGHLDVAELPEWLVAVECPAAAALLPARSQDQLSELFAMAVDAVMRGVGEDAVSGLDREIAADGILSVAAPIACRMGLAWLGLADYEAAHRWASVAAFTAGDADTADCAVGHLIAAHASMRLGQFATADQQAKAAAELFGGFGARNLELFAVLTRAHVAAEAGEPMPALPELPSAAHPALVLYRAYVFARGSLLAGRVDPAVRAFFDCGRTLRACGVTNPSLLNWRPHMVALFRASGQHDFMRHVEDDLVCAWREWAELAPAAAARRGEVLGSRLSEVLAPAAPVQEAPSVEQLSAAELRVVDLVVKGASNRDAAKELFLSKRTVDTHLGNVYRKLGLGSRAELTELMQRLAPRSASSLHVFG